MPRLERLHQGNTAITVFHVDDNETLPDIAGPLETTLERDGAVLVRGLGLQTPQEFGKAIAVFGQPVTSYRGGNTPRSVGFSSTEHPPQYAISQHNELSYAHTWPDRLYFCCLVPAETGGATPVCDGRALLAELDPDVRSRFTRLGVEYRQYLHGGDGFGKSWQDTFETTDRSLVESYLAEAEAGFAWTGDGSLRIVHRRPAVRSHPRTGETVWFNQADQWHPSNLPGDEAAALIEAVGGEQNLPHSVAYGDGTPIPDTDLALVREATRRHTLAVPWQAGDLMLVDNMLALHGREPYTEHRRVLSSVG